MAQSGFFMIPSLFITLATIIVMGFGFVRVIGMMIMKELDVVPGFLALAALLGIFAVTIYSHSEFVAGATFVVMLTLMAFYPFAETQLEKLQHREIDVAGLEKAFQTAIQRPDNIAVRFQIAQIVYDLGLHGHAIAISETTLQALSTQWDDVQNRSLRDVFRGEEQTVKQWRRTLRDPQAFREVACPKCGKPNPPGQLACVGCGGPFLLELARRLDKRSSFVGKLVLSWAALAVFLVAAVMMSTKLSGVPLYLMFFVALGLVGGLLSWLFRDPQLGRQRT
ncbi:MAG: zinc ribbon domain-containing protein [Fimbriimonadaceae bacterium]|nr:zinc ribbon domain-containing protein [Fimbriimonadaceae bacterium]